MKSGIAMVMAVLCLSAGLAETTSAAPIATLTEENSTVQVDLGSAGVGMNQWSVDGLNRLQEQSFWYRVGDTPQQRVNTSTYVNSVVYGNDYLTANYADPSN